MEQKPIQDIAPPAPEIVGDIPVRAPAAGTEGVQKPPSTSNEDSSFLVPAQTPPVAAGKGQQKVGKVSKPKPTLAIIIAVIAVICLAAGVYFKYFANT